MNEYQYHIFSPYRVCPLGAHVDHQHGLVTGFAINKGVDLWFNVREDNKVKLSSRSFEGEVEFEIDRASQVKEGMWGDNRTCNIQRFYESSSYSRMVGHRGRLGQSS